MPFILAIESAVYGGSATLLDGDTVVGEWVGTEPRGSSDQLLPSIQKKMDEAGLTGRQLHAIAVSNGPGSYTGIRIGIATALGLATALGIRTAGISLLEALALVYGRPGQIASAVPFGRDQIAFQTFELSPGYKINAEGGPIALKFDEFSSERLKACASIVVDRSLYERLENLEGDMNPIDGGHNLSLAIGRSFNRTGLSRPPEAIYVRN